jgi:hypothetical protein
MSYINADTLLPPELLREVQTYVQGSLVYIPREDGEKRLGWGSRSGARKTFDERNSEIRAEKSKGRRIDDLADAYGLSPGGIRKILYGSRKREKA